MQTLNLDLIQPWATMNRMIFELQHCQSANVNFVFDPDKARIKQWSSVMRSLVDDISTNPGYLDLPETNPRPFDLSPMIEEKDIENDAIKHLCTIVRLGMLELQGSQSSRFSSGIANVDKVRLTAIFDKVEKHVAQHVDQQTPIDYPESSPRSPLQGAGIGGIGNGNK
jgi:hypothetical protein